MNIIKKQLTPQQKKRLERVAKLVSDSPIAITQHLFDIEERLDKEVPTHLQNILDKVKGAKGEDGVDGKKGDKGEKGEPGNRGNDGKNGERGEQGETRY